MRRRTPSTTSSERKRASVISKDEVRAIFAANLPDDVTIKMVPRLQHVETLRHHDYIREQIRIGIYDEGNLENDLLSAVSSYVMMRRIEICYDLLADYMKDVPDDVTLGYLLAVALHEGYHFKAGPTYSLDDHIEQEREANEHVRTIAPTLWEHHQRFEELSPVFRRVYARMRKLGLMA